MRIVRTRIGILLLTCLFLISGCGVSNKVQSTDSKKSFDAYLDKLFIEELESSPINATFSIGDLAKYNLTDLLTQMDDMSPEALAALVTDAEKDLNTLKTFHRDELNEEQQKTYDVVEFRKEMVIAAKDFLYYESIIQPSAGIQIEIPLALMQIEWDSTDEVDAYLERVKKLPKLFDQVIAYEQERSKEGVLLPENQYADVVKQIEDMLADPDTFMMTQSFNDKISKMPNLTEEKMAAYKATFLEIVKTELFPAFEKLKAEATVLMTTTINEGGISNWPKSKEYYTAIIKNETSYDMSIENLRQWASNQKSEAITAMQDLYATNPEVFEADLTTIFPAYNSIQEIYDIENKVLADQFKDYGIKEATENIIPEYLQANLAAGFYFPLSADGEDYGNMYLRQDAYDKITADTLLLYLHENIPGHHLYFSLLSQSDLPMIRKIDTWTTYDEGWAQYVQTNIYAYTDLAPEYVTLFIANEQYSNALMVELDIQVHVDGMSRAEAIDLLAQNGYPEEDAASSVDRLIGTPGEMIHYMYGAYKFNQYRAQCEKALGKSFDLKEFHDLVLRNIGLPFTTMDEVVTNYCIAAVKSE